MSSFWGPFFLKFLRTKNQFKIFLKRVCTEKLHRIKVSISQKSLESIFYEEKNSFSGAKNLSVNTWRSGPDICSLICDGNETFPVGILSDGREILEVFEQTPSAFMILLIYVEVTKIQGVISFLTFFK